MTLSQYRAALAALGLTQAGAAELMHISIRTSNGYANGWPIPFLVEFYLEHAQLNATHEMPVEAPPMYEVPSWWPGAKP